MSGGIHNTESSLIFWVVVVVVVCATCFAWICGQKHTKMQLTTYIYGF
jgi:hypothetical protein